MLELVEITSERGEKLTLPITDTSSGILVKDVQGLDPVKASLVTSKYALRDGEYYHSSRRESRNIVITLDLDSRYGGDSISDIRSRIYSVALPKRLVTLSFMTQTGFILETLGVVEDVTLPMFSKSPKAVISIVCHDPDLIDPLVNTASGVSLMTEMQHSLVEYEGTAPSGYIFDMVMTSATSIYGFTLQTVDPAQNTTEMHFTYGYQTGDRVIINTIPGEKEVTLIRGGSEESVLHGVSPQSTWPLLEQGENFVGVLIDDDIATAEYTITYNERYEALS